MESLKRKSNIQADKFKVYNVSKQTRKLVHLNSFDTGMSETSRQEQDGGRPKRSNIPAKFPPPFVIAVDFNPAARSFFVKVARSDGLGKNGGLLRIRTVPAINVVFERGSEFSLSLKEELGRFRIVRSLYSNFLGIRGLN
ncbi:hypothetical protein AVEN_229121-1 [Araneus ventricosus]|uniref:Uncharacterized protein n=1 Tax=Araneus ventricosus TaxID=182803 RepID=A0A4Y2FJ20_ARAVE|nr:hypothetical protein AVEN_229121-1 [Araneus ventricosus]